MKGAIILMLLVIVLSDNTKNDGFYNIGDSIDGEIVDGGPKDTVIVINVDQKNPNSFLFFILSVPRDQVWQRMTFDVYNKQDKVISCANQGMDQCYLNSDDVNKGQTLTVIVSCEKACKFRFSTYWNALQEIKRGETIQLKFPQGGKAFFFKYTPSGANFNQLKFILIPKTKASMFDYVKILANTNGKLPKADSHTFQSIVLWNGGQGLFLRNQQMQTFGLNLLVLGSSQNVYLLKCDLIDENQHKLNFNEPYHDYLPQTHNHWYHIPFQKTQQQIIYCIRVQVFTGQLVIGFYQDDQRKQHFQAMPIIYRGSAKYVFSSKTLSSRNISSLQAVINSVNTTPATFTITLQKQRLINAGLLQKDIYLFTSIKYQKFLYFPFKGKQDLLIPQQYFQFSIIVYTMINQTLPVVFRLCLQSVIDCTSNVYVNTTSILKSTVQNAGVKSQYYLKIPVDQAQFGGHIIIEILTPSSDMTSFIVMKYSDLNEMSKMIDNQPIYEKINLDQIKYYVYSDDIPKRKYVAFHCNIMNGNMQMHMSRLDPRDTNVQTKLVDNNYILIEDDLNKPIYITLKGITHSTYILNTIVIKQQIGGSNQTQTNIIKLLSNLDYTFTIPPAANQFVSIQALGKPFTLSYQSTGSVATCIISNGNDSCVKQPSILGNKISQLINATQNQVIIRLVNINRKKNIQVTLNYVIGSKTQCIVKTIGQLQTDVFPGTACLKYPLSQFQDLKGVFLRTELAQLRMKVQLCQRQIQLSSVQFEIKKKTIIDYCQNTSGNKFLTINLDTMKSNDTSMKVLYLVQHSSRTLQLPDGISYTESLISSSSRLKKYYYRVLNLVNTQILVHQKIGKVTIFTKIVQDNRIDQTQPRPDDFERSSDSSSGFFDKNPNIKITPQMYQGKKCQNCVVIITVYTAMSSGSQISYSIQVTQNMLQLNDHEQHHIFLPQGSSSYYRYDCKKNGQSLYFNVNDNNQQCAKLILGNKQYPSQQENIQVSISNKITVKCQKDSYFLAIKAVSDCPITVSAQSANFKLTKITSGTAMKLTLSKGQIQYFSFSHPSNQSFKLVAIESVGKLKIYLTKATEELLKTLTQSNDIPLQIFDIKNTYLNSLEVLPKTKGFCSRCIYIAAVKAQENLVDASLLLIQNNQHILMTLNKVLYDQLDISQATFLKYYNVLKGSIHISLLSGRINLEAHYKGRKIEKEIIDKQKSIQIDFDFNTNGETYDWSPIVFKINNQNKQLAAYTIQVFKDADVSGGAPTMKRGVPNYLQVKRQDNQCFKGIFSSVDDKIYLSTQKTNQEYLSKLNITTKFNGDSIQNKIIQIQNNIQLEYQKIDTRANYLVCISNPTKFSIDLMVLQSSNIHLIQPNTWGVVKNQQIYLLHPDRKFLVDLYTCKGQLSYYSSSTYQQTLSQKQQNFIKVDSTFKLQNSNDQQRAHAIYLDSFYSTIFLKVKAPVSLIRWMEVDQQKQIGSGYKIYQAGSISPKVEDDKIILIWQPIKLIKKTKTIINKVQYRMLVGLNPQELKGVTNCQIVNTGNFYLMNLQYNNNGEVSQMTTTIPKQKIKQQIVEETKSDSNLTSDADLTAVQKNNLYIILIADAVIGVPNGQNIFFNEQYRFIYKTIQLPRSIVFDQQNSKRAFILFIIAGVGLSILTITCLVYICLKKIIPLISRLRQRNLIQENVAVGTQSKPSIQEGYEGNQVGTGTNINKIDDV